MLSERLSSLRRLLQPDTGSDFVGKKCYSEAEDVFLWLQRLFCCFNLRKFVEQHGDEVGWNESNRAY
jgi:hypothetical protein